MKNPFQNFIASLKESLSSFSALVTKAQRSIPAGLPADSDLRPVVEKLESGVKSDGAAVEAAIGKAIEMLESQEFLDSIEKHIQDGITERLGAAVQEEIDKKVEAKELFTKASVEVAENAAADKVRDGLKKHTERNAKLKEVFGEFPVDGVPEAVLSGDDAGFDTYLTSMKERRSKLEKAKLLTGGTLTEMASLKADDEAGAERKIKTWQEFSKGVDYTPPGGDDDRFGRDDVLA